MSTPLPKILVLGLDGMTFDVIRPLIQKGALPTIAGIMKEGTSAALKSTVMPNSFPAWVSMTTGVNPGKHGIFWSLIRPEALSHSLRLMSSRDIGARRIWQILGDAGFKVGVFNLPTEYPPYSVNGFLVCGALTPDVSHPFTFPETLKDEILGLIPDYRCEIDYARMGLQGLSGELFHSINNREKILLHFLKHKPWDFLMAVFTETDLAQHMFWAGIDARHPRHAQFRKKFGSIVHDVYRRLDEMLGKVLDAVPKETTIMVVSDHGFGPFYQAFSLPLWLKDNGYLSLKEEHLRKLAKDILIKSELKGMARAVQNRILALWFGLQGKGSVRHMRDREAVAGRGILDRIQWDRTRAYFAPDYGIRLNMKGRDPRGIVTQGIERRHLLDEIKEKLKSCVYSNGEPVFETVLLNTEVFSGPYTARAPDLVVPINHAGAPPRPEIWPYTLTHPTLTGTHTPFGILLAKGPGIRKSHRLDRAQVMDIAPTILDIGRIPVPQEMDGHVLRGLFLGEGSGADGANNNGAGA